MSPCLSPTFATYKSLLSPPCRGFCVPGNCHIEQAHLLKERLNVACHQRQESWPLPLVALSGAQKMQQVLVLIEFCEDWPGAKGRRVRRDQKGEW